MSRKVGLPRILVIDDQFGRETANKNQDRLNFCRSHRLIEVTGKSGDASSELSIRDPIAEAVFFRGQLPVRASVGDFVYNDLDGILSLLAPEPGVDNSYRIPWALVLLDLCFYTGSVTAESEALRGPGMPEGVAGDEQPQTLFGLEILVELTERFPETPIAILSSVPQWQVKDEYIHRGAVGFLPKGGIGGPELLEDYLFDHALVPDFEGEVVGHSKALLRCLRVARRSTIHDRPVLIRGERGTGKELLANYIHRQRSRSGTVPFVRLNCGQFSDPNMAFSALFGHKKGAFTGADSNRMGAVQSASAGLLFLDEIGNLPLPVQAGLHRLLQEGEYSPLGAEETATRDFSAKLLAATNTDLEGLTLKDPPQFFPDLLDRLKLGDVVYLPSLRDRLEDLPDLTLEFVRQAERELPGAFQGREIAPEVFDLLTSYDWPGNIRELGACIRRAVSAYKHIEILTARCIEPLAGGVSRPRGASTPGSLQAGEAQELQSLRRNCPDFVYDALNPRELTARLPEIQNRHQQEMADYLSAVLQATSRPSPDHPEGEILLHPAAKLMTGDRSISASEAADLFKRLLRPLEKAADATLFTPWLQNALARAVKIRPSRPPEE
jgi:DNA-binding NtrC family response regulator